MIRSETPRAAIEKFSDCSGGVLIRWKKPYPLMPMNKPEDSTLWVAGPDKPNQFLQDVATRDSEKYLGPAGSSDDGDEETEGVRLGSRLFKRSVAGPAPPSSELQPDPYSLKSMFGDAIFR